MKIYKTPKLKGLENKAALVHKHRGGSLYCGVPRFQEACTRLENYLIQNQTELREQLYKQLLDEFDKVCNGQMDL